MKRGRWRSLWRRSSDIDAEIRDELEFHLEMRTRENIARGQDPAMARVEAERRFGRSQQYAWEMCTVDRRRRRRQSRRLWWLALKQDLSYAARAHGRQPGFTLVLLLTLGLGIGANAALFAVANRMLFTEVAGVRDV